MFGFLKSLFGKKTGYTVTEDEGYWYVEILEEVDELGEDVYGNKDIISIHNISGNLNELSEDISQLKKLKFLNLEECSNLTALPDSIGDLKKLHSLMLDETSIETLPNKLPPNLIVLKMTSMPIEDVPAQVFKLKKLRELELVDLPIEKLSSAIQGLTDLKSLRVLHCADLEELPEEVGQLEKLTTLQLWNSGFRQLPSQITSLSKLQTLDISDTSIDELPDDLGNLTALQHLRIGGTDITALPKSVTKLKKLKSLSLSGDIDIPWTLLDMEKSKKLKITRCN